MKYAIEHELRLAFSEPIREHHVELRLTPRDGGEQRLGAAAIEVEPAAGVRRHVDCFGNRVDTFDVIAPHEALAIRLRATVETRLENPFAFAPIATGREREWIEQALRREPSLLDFVLHRGTLTPAGAEGEALFRGAPAWDGRAPLIDAVTVVRDWVGERTEATAEADEEGGTSAAAAQALVALVRAWGVPARFVRGYRDCDDEPAVHYWAEVLLPGGGWRGFDPASGLVVHDRYVAVAVGRDAGDVPPLRQVFQGEPGGEPARVRVRLERGEAEQ